MNLSISALTVSPLFTFRQQQEFGTDLRHRVEVLRRDGEEPHLAVQLHTQPRRYFRRHQVHVHVLPGPQQQVTHQRGVHKCKLKILLLITNRFYFNSFRFIDFILLCRIKFQELHQRTLI